VTLSALADEYIEDENILSLIIKILLQCLWI